MNSKLFTIIKALLEAYKPIEKVNWLYATAKVIIWLYSRLLLRMNIRQLSPLPDGPKIFAANHPSFTDPFLLHLHDRMSILVTGKAFASPFLGKLLRKIGEIPVHPGGDSLKTAIRRLKAGTSIGIFPEGQITPPESTLLKGRSGAARLALSTGVSIIPVGIHLDRKRLKKTVIKSGGQALPSYVYLRGDYAVTFGEPIQFNGDPEDRELVNQVTVEIMEQIAALAKESEMRMRSKVSASTAIINFLKSLFPIKNIGIL